MSSKADLNDLLKVLKKERLQFEHQAIFINGQIKYNEHMQEIIRMRIKELNAVKSNKKS